MRRLPWSCLFLAIGLLLVDKQLLAQTIVWSGTDATAGVNTNWSDVNNWTGGTPGSAANIYFFDAGANSAQGVLNNIISANTTILSLQYGNTNGFHTTQINAGVTLTVSDSGAANLVFAGTGTDNGVSQTLYSTVTGPGSLVVNSGNSGSAFFVQQGSANNGVHMATLDMSGLANFNLTVGRLLVGNGGSAGSSNWPSGRLYLAGTNTIRVNGAGPAIDVGDSFMNTGTNYIYMGRTNAIYADSMAVGRQKCTSTLAFNASMGGNPVLYLNGNTNSRVTALAIGDFSAQTGSGSITFGTMNLLGGTVNAQVNTCYVA
ncbi:MAG TPA: hypothetical protein VNU95_16595, partial [Candidatus Acidoferrales bacterium]|nr:hypothetical protein [Candidatus Acidoferrales bacterium]